MFPSAVIQKREWPAVNVQSAEKDGWIILTTSVMTLNYRINSGSFNADNLNVTWNDSTGSHHWYPGKIDSLNLGGLTYSLDNIKADNIPKAKTKLLSPVHDTIPGIDVILSAAEPGLLSLNGYAFIDDSGTPVWNDKKQWIEPRQDTSGIDWYLFIYGRNYKKVLNEYAELSGRIPMIPRYTLGPWITDLNFEYFPDSYKSHQPEFEKYNEEHLKNEIMQFRENNIPLDIFVLDFGWHNYGWQGGYDWSPLIPKPLDFLSWLHSQGIKVTLNDHPGYANTDMSILSYKDSHAPKVLKDLGMPIPRNPAFNMDILGTWKFMIDSSNKGTYEGWYKVNYNDSIWKTIEVGIPWQNQGYNYHGIAWYRKSINLPSKLPDSLYLYLGEVRDSYQCYINGVEAKHNELHWPQRLTYTGISKYIKPGEMNEIAVRVESKRNESGIISKPVSIENVKPPQRIHFDLSNKKQAEVFMNDLHKPLDKHGINFWWVDGGSGSVDMPGLNKQMWTNHIYYTYNQKYSNERGFIFSRYGGWGSQRYPAFFTGDTYSEWPVLAYEVIFTAVGGNILIPYITHDIGGFHGRKINFDLYARWIEFGTFSPILRLHSAHENPSEGNLRMPWTYGKEGLSLAKKYFTLRIQLIPYIYTYTRMAYDESMPIVRPLYLEYPDLKEAYEYPHEYFFGKEMLAAPITDSTGTRQIYLPPGNWMNFFTGEKYNGGSSFEKHYNIDEIPVFVREGSIIPGQPAMNYSNEKPLDTLILNFYGSGNGNFNLYEDDGTSLKFKDGKYAWTEITYLSDTNSSTHQIIINPSKGSFDNQVQNRAYKLIVHGIIKPVTVSLNKENNVNWKWDSERSNIAINVPAQSIRKKITVILNR